VGISQPAQNVDKADLKAYPTLSIFNRKGENKMKWYLLLMGLLCIIFFVLCKEKDYSQTLFLSSQMYFVGYTIVNILERKRK
jgi:hypothetical protein